jgi:hypothetical protein
MLQSHVIEIDGTFVGAAIRQHNGYRFVAVDVRLEELDATVWPTLADVQRLARRLFLTGRLHELPPLTHVRPTSVRAA